MKLNEHFILFILKLVSCFSQKLNSKKRLVIAQRLGSIIYCYLPLRKKIAKQNIEKAFPHYSDKHKNNILKKSYTFFIEQFLIFLGFPNSYHQYNVIVNNKVILDNNLKKNKGILFITGHFGFWEYIVAWFGKNNYPLTGIAQKQNNKGANDFFIAKREWSGIKHIFRKDSIDNMNKVLTNNGILGLVSDQDAKNRGIFVNFFNIPSSTHKGPARFYQKHKSIPIFGVCVKKGYNQLLIKFIEVKGKDILDTFTFTQKFTSILESEIKRYPEQYFWWHNRWKTSPLPRNA